MRFFYLLQYQNLKIKLDSWLTVVQRDGASWFDKNIYHNTPEKALLSYFYSKK